MPEYNLAACIICDLHYTDADEVTALSCGHVYHQSCVAQWIRSSNSCPSCRASKPRLQRIFLGFREIVVENTEDVSRRLQSQLEEVKKVFESEKMFLKGAHEVEKTKMAMNVENSIRRVAETEKVVENLRLEIASLSSSMGQLQEENKKLKLKQEELKRQNLLYFRKNTQLEKEKHSMPEPMRHAQKSSDFMVSNSRQPGVHAASEDDENNDDESDDFLAFSGTTHQRILTNRSKAGKHIAAAPSFTSRLGSVPKAGGDIFNSSKIPAQPGIHGFFARKKRGFGS